MDFKLRKKRRENDPIPGETASEYMDRMLGPVGSKQRKIGDPAAYKMYLRIWDSYHRIYGTVEPKDTNESKKEPIKGFSDLTFSDKLSLNSKALERLRRGEGVIIQTGENEWIMYAQPFHKI